MACPQTYTLGDALNFPLTKLKNREQFCLGRTKASKGCRRIIRLENQVDALSILNQCVSSFEQGDQNLKSDLNELAQLLIQGHHSEQRQTHVKEWTERAKEFIAQEENRQVPAAVERQIDPVDPISLGYFIHPHHFDENVESEPTIGEDLWDSPHNTAATDEENQIIEVDEPVQEATYDLVQFVPNVNHSAREDKTKQHTKALPLNPNMTETYTPITFFSLFFGLFLQFGVMICGLFNLESGQTRFLDHEGNVQDSSVIHLNFELGIRYSLEALNNLLWWAMVRGVILLLLCLLPGWTGALLLMCWVGRQLWGGRSMELGGRRMCTIK